MTATAPISPEATSTRVTVAARTSLVAGATFLALLALVHLLRPDLDPSWRVISDYALGPHGWMMSIAFGSLGLACGALAVSIGSRAGAWAGRIGAGILALCAVGLGVAALFPTDPVGTAPEAATTSGQLHMLGATLGGLVPLAAPLATWMLTRGEVGARERWQLWSAVALVWIGELVFVGAMATMAPDDGRLGPTVLVGWPNRLMIVSYAAWVMVAARHLARTSRPIATLD